MPAFKPKKNKQKPLSFIAMEEITLIQYLCKVLNGKSRVEVKQMLAHKQILINGTVTRKATTMLMRGNKIEVLPIGTNTSFENAKLKIVYEDDSIIVANKKVGLLTMSANKGEKSTAYSILMEYVQRQHRDNRIFIVHRLDRETSGLLVFAKSASIQEKLQTEWTERVENRIYVALLEGRVEKNSGTIESWLKENPVSLKSYSSYDDNGGKRAVTHFRVIKRNSTSTLVEFELETGRKNQIRVHSELINHPIAGDKKYGAQTDPLRRMCLHARTLAFYHPKTGELMTFDSGIPDKFK